MASGRTLAGDHPLFAKINGNSVLDIPSGFFAVISPEKQRKASSLLTSLSLFFL